MENEQLKKEIEQLTTKVAALEQWKSDRERQQITAPLDSESIAALSEEFLRVTGSRTYTAGASAKEFVIYLLKQGQYQIEASKDTTSEFYVDPSNDTFTSLNEPMQNDWVVNVLTSDTLPSPLVANTDYYVISASGNTFKLSTTLGGSAINITTSGAGPHYIYAI